jgi:hypothetical protein
MRIAVKALIVNLLLVVGVFGVIELGYRGVKFVDSCLSKECDASYWTLGNKFNHDVDIGLSRQDAVLGHVPNDGEYFIDGPGLNTSKITIREGVRVNASFEPPINREPTLAVGDSYTFGDDVSDNETWPACLERQWHTRVVNGGVFGYGAAQAVLRAQQMERQHRYDRVIWSILIGHDFERDGLIVRSDSPRPAVISDTQGVRYATIGEAQRALDQTTRRGLAKYAHLFGYSYVTKMVWGYLSRYVLPPGASYDGRWTIRHPQAASRPQLISFAFDQFAALSAPQKYVLIQYPKESVTVLDRAEAAEVDAIRELAAQRNIPVVDSLRALRAEPDRDMLYRRHHTPAGNWIVCRSIVAAVARPRTDE